MMMSKVLTLIIFFLFAIYCTNSTNPTNCKYGHKTIQTTVEPSCVKNTNECASEQYGYGIVIDAGSTSSRIFAFKWKERTEDTPRSKGASVAPKSEPEEILMNCENVQKGKINGFSINEAGAVSDIATLKNAKKVLGKMINYVKGLHEIAELGEQQWKEIPIYLKATAGLRLVLDHTQRINILKYLRTVFKDGAINPFKFKETYSIIASGTEEATFDWLGVNYLKEKLKGEGSKTYGALDLGGASTQIAFVPEDTSDIIDEYTFTKPLGFEFRLYAVSHLGYGTQQIEKQIAAKVYSENNQDGAKNPCLFNGLKKTYYIKQEAHNKRKTTRVMFDDEKKPKDGYNKHEQTGSSDPEECEKYLRAALHLVSPTCDVFSEHECSVNGVYIPPIPPNMKWIAFSSFYYTVGALLSKQNGDGGLTDPPSISELYGKTKELCAKSWKSLSKAASDGQYPYQPIEKFQKTLCLLNMYVVVLLRDGYHFNVEARDITWTKKIERKGKPQEVGWQWGSILYDANVLGYKSHFYSVHKKHYENKKRVQNELPTGSAAGSVPATRSVPATGSAPATGSVPATGSAQIEYMDYMDDMNDGNRYYHQMNPLLLTVSVIFMMVIICIYCICGLGVIGFYSFCCYHQYNKATSDQQHIDIESL